MRNALMAAAVAVAVAALLVVSPAAAATWSVSGREISYRERSEEETRVMFEDWKAKYWKSYSSVGEEERRYAIFKDVVRKVDQHDAAADAGLDVARLGLNGLTDLTAQEWEVRCGVWPEREEQERLFRGRKIMSGGSTILGQMTRIWKMITMLLIQ